MLNRAGWIIKKKQDELAKEREKIETSKIYAEYVKEFDASGQPNVDVLFVKAGTGPEEGRTKLQDAGVTTSASGTQDAQATLEIPHDPLSKEYLNFVQAPVHATQTRATTQGKTREIDAFIQELKEKQERDEEIKALQQRLQQYPSPIILGEGRMHSPDKPQGFSDPGSAGGVSTLYVGNLHPNIKEEDLFNHFSSSGTITSIRITCNKVSGSNDTASALITFANADIANRAKDTKDHTEILGYRCLISWAHFGRQVVTPPPPPPGFSVSVSPVIPPPPPPPPKPALLAEEKGITVTLPSSKELQRIIDLTASYVAERGSQFEEMILSKETEDGLFRFLHDRRSPDHVYYRWKTYSLLQGNDEHEFSREPFRIVQDGVTWNPPSIKDLSEEILLGGNTYSHYHDNSSEKVSGPTRGWKPILDEDSEKLKEMLKNPSGTREGIGKVMIFIIDHGESAYLVTDILIDSIKENTDMIGTKINRMYIMNDVLFNTSASHQFAWLYRLSIEKRLPEVFQHLAEFNRICASKIAREQLNTAVRKMLVAWHNWTVYQDEFLGGLEAIFFGHDILSFEEQTSFKENSHLLDPVQDGQEMEFYHILSKIPLKWREVGYGYLTMRIKKLKQLCASRGLLIYPDTRVALVARLVSKDIYWDTKEDTMEQPYYEEDILMQENADELIYSEEAPTLSAEPNETATTVTTETAAPIDSGVCDESSDSDMEEASPEPDPEPKLRPEPGRQPIIEKPPHEKLASVNLHTGQLPGVPTVPKVEQAWDDDPTPASVKIQEDDIDDIFAS